MHAPSCLSADLCVHVLELSKLPGRAAAASDRAVLIWAKSLVAETDQELEPLAMIDPEIPELNRRWNGCQRTGSPRAGP